MARVRQGRRWARTGRTAVLAVAASIAAVGLASCSTSPRSTHPLASPAAPASGASNSGAAPPSPVTSASPATTAGTDSPLSTTDATSTSTAGADPSAPPTSATSAPDPRAALAQLVASIGSHAAASPVGSTASYAAVAYASGATSGPAADVATLVNVYHWTGSTWDAVATGLGSGAWLNPMVGFTVTGAALTGGPVTDFVVSGAAGASANGLFVVGDVNGRWTVVPVQHPGGGPVFVDSRVVGDQVEESVNDCVPNCAAGRVTTTSYRYSPAAGEFEPVQAPTGSG